MNTMLRLTIAATLAALFAGCATTTQPNQGMLTYESVPAGATIYEAGKPLGVAPVTRTYPMGEGVEYVATPEVTAVWASGAKATYWTNLKSRADLVATIERPSGAPGIEKDLEAAKPLMDQKTRDAQRTKDENARALARDSARCREQMQKGNMATNDC